MQNARITRKYRVRKTREIYRAIAAPACRRKNRFLESRRLVDSPKLARSRLCGYNKISNKSALDVRVSGGLGSSADKDSSHRKKKPLAIPWGKSRSEKSGKFEYGNRCPMEYALRSKLEVAIIQGKSYFHIRSRYINLLTDKNF